MTLEEAIQWIDPDKRPPKVEEIENADGIDTADIVIQKFNEACLVILDELGLRNNQCATNAEGE